MRFRITAASLLAAVLALASGCAASASSARVSHYQSFGVSFRFPSAWTRVNYSCWGGTMETPLVGLTTAPTAPVCGRKKKPSIPRKKLAHDGLSVVWVQGGRPGLRWFWPLEHSPTTSVGGQPARTVIVTPEAPHWKAAGCSLTGGNRAMVTQVRSPYAVDNYYEMAACLRGPHFAANERALRTMVASVRFHIQK